MTIATTFQVQQANGLWLDLNDHVNYYVGANSFESYAQTWRRTMATSPYMEGSYQIHAVPENGNEMVTVYCLGATYAETIAAAELVLDAFKQHSYKVLRTIESVTQIWDCYTADYTVKLANTYVNSKMATIEFSIPRLPTYTTNITPEMTTVDGGIPSSTYESLIQGVGP